MIRLFARWSAVLAIVLLAACAQSEPSLYQRLGGTPGIAAVVDDFVDNVRADPAVGKRFQGVDIDRLKMMLTDRLCQDAGGPCTGRSMKDIYRGTHISDAEFNGMAGDMAKTLDKFRLPRHEHDEVLAWLNARRGDVVGQ